VLRGGEPYVADIKIPGCLDVAFVRSDVAHAELRGVDLDAARELPGVIVAIAAGDLPGLAVPPAPLSGQPDTMRRHALATDRVRFVGEPVAAVVAENRYVAADAAELVVIDVEPLPHVLDPRAATGADAPGLFEGTDNVSSTREMGADLTAVEEALASAPVVVTASLSNQRVAPTSIEPRGIVVEPRDVEAQPSPRAGAAAVAGEEAVPGEEATDGEAYRVWCSHQAPHRLRDGLATAFGLDPEAIRVSVPRVGGAFGGKSQTHAEYLVVFALARLLGRPVRWIEDRTEALIAATHGRGQTAEVRLAADREGRMLALDVEIDADVGAYPDNGDFIPAMTGWVISGPYAIPTVRVRSRSVLTNKAPTAAYRGAGRPEAAYFLERTVDMLADRLGVDPVQVRRRSFVPPDAFPYSSPTGAVYDSGRYASALDLALELAGYEGWRREQRRRRAEERAEEEEKTKTEKIAGSEPGPLLGIGVASWIERTGGGRGMAEFAEVEATERGEILARVGIASQGQGHEVTFAQVAADALGLSPDQVRVQLGDTARVRHGTGAFGSKSMQVGGSALYRAGRALLTEAHRRAGEALGGPVDYADGRFRSAGGRELTLGDLVSRGGRLVAHDTFAPPQAFPFGSYVAVVEVDRRTGAVDVLRFVAVDDCGVVVNPDIVEGQILGSIAQGVGQALYEQVVYGEDGQPLTATLLDYTVPTAAEIPEVMLGTHVTPNPNVPLGTKGTGESGCIGAPPALVNAVWDALSGYDRSELRMPLTAARVWQCLQRPASASH
jgi:CO/xanthine dehydrogenase Mo-binding subunit